MLTSFGQLSTSVRNADEKTVRQDYCLTCGQKTPPTTAYCCRECELGSALHQCVTVLSDLLLSRALIDRIDYTAIVSAHENGYCVLQSSVLDRR